MTSTEAPSQPVVVAPRAADAVVRALALHGVDRVFCVAGESYLAVLDALRDPPAGAAAIDVVTCRHEGSAAFAAVADAKLRRRAGVCLVNRGPGATNAAIALHSAYQDATPLVLLVGHVHLADIGREVFQELDCERTFSAMAKAVWTVHDPRRAAEAVTRALRVAESGTPGPAVVVLPEDVLGQPVPELPGRRMRPAVAAPGAGDVARCRVMLATARRPLLIAGDRLGSADGRRLLGRVAREYHLPVVTSNKRQDLFDNRDPRYAGQLTIATPAARRRQYARADLVLAVGTRLDSVTTQSHRLPGPDQALVHVYPDADRLGHVHTPTLAVAADPVEFLQALLAAGPLPPRPGPEADADWLAALRAEEEQAASWRRVPAADGIPFGAVVAAVDALAPENTVFTVDAGNFTSWVHRYLRLHGGRRLLGVASSAMGFGIPAGLGAALRYPGRPVVAFVGDGGFLMTGTELATAVASSCRLVVVVADNGSYGTIRQHQERAYPGRVIATTLVNPDFAALARAFGARGLTVRDEQEIDGAVAEALETDGPAVVHVRTSLEWISAYQRLPHLAREGGKP